MFRRVAIIGGGAAGAALLSELIERAPDEAGLHLDWYAGEAPLARGVAYGTGSARHLLNVRAATMGMFSGKPQGFLDYARRLDPSVAGTDFLPRKLYGDYLQAETARALALAPQRGIDVRVVPFAADALVPEADGVTVFRGEETRRVDAAVLAIGALPAQPLAAVGESALASGRYVVDPWPLLANPPAEVPGHVMVVGLGLTAADVLLELAARWPEARFTAISRHGRLPEPHAHAATPPLGDGAALAAAMLDAADLRVWLPMVREAMAQEEDWRCTIDSLRPHVGELWAALPPDQRARFLRHLRAAWERARHRMPQPTADGLATLERDGRLQRRRGRLSAVGAQGDGLFVALHAHGDDAPRELHADLVVQATGMEFDVAATTDPLLHQLVLNRHVLPDPLGLGCQATPQGQLRHADGAWPHVLAIGSLLRGTLWETTAMPEIRQQARIVADQLLARSPDPA
jgi:uncharacterized NAD(P)/FAD-binding protein YdhS